MKSLTPLLYNMGFIWFCPIKANLIFIIADDLTFRDIGCYGGQAIRRISTFWRRKDAFRAPFPVILDVLADAA